MIRIAITVAFDAVSARLPLGTVSFEREPDDNGERLIWLEPHAVDKLRAPARLRRKLQRRYLEAGGGDGPRHEAMVTA